MGGLRDLVAWTEPDYSEKKMIEADRANYWRTGQRDPDTQLDRAACLIIDAGGVIKARGIGMFGGNEAVLLGYELDGESYRITWPVLIPRNEDSLKDRRAARIQAATFVYHDVKSKCMAAQVLGTRAAMLPYLLTANGRTMAELSNPELEKSLPKMLPEAK